MKRLWILSGFLFVLVVFVLWYIVASDYGKSRTRLGRT
jgi:hypothetical protein